MVTGSNETFTLKVYALITPNGSNQASNSADLFSGLAAGFEVASSSLKGDVLPAFNEPFVGSTSSFGTSFTSIYGALGLGGSATDATNSGASPWYIAVPSTAPASGANHGANWAYLTSTGGTSTTASPSNLGVEYLLGTLQVTFTGYSLPTVTTSASMFAIPDYGTVMSKKYQWTQDGTSEVAQGSNALVGSGANSTSILYSNAGAGISPMTFVLAGSLVWTGSQSGAWDSTTMNWNYSGIAGTFTNGDAVTFDDTACTASVVLNSNVAPGSVFFNNNTLPYTLSGIGGISGTCSLTKAGTGTLMLGCSNAYSGGTIINAGLLQAGNNSALGASAGPLAVNGGTLDVHGYSLNVGPLTGTGTIDNLSGSGALTAGNGNASSTFAGTMQNTVGQLSLTKTGTGTLTLTAQNSVGGSFIVDGGTLQVPSGSLLTSGNLTVGNTGNGAFSQTGGTAVLASSPLYRQ